MHVTPQQFHAALENPHERATIGLVISDADASELLGNPEWEQNYFAQWSAMAPVITAVAEPQIPDTGSAWTAADDSAQELDPEEPAEPRRKGRTPKEPKQPQDISGRRPRKLLRTTLAVLIVLAAFAAGGATVMALTGTSLSDVVASQSTATAPADGHGVRVAVTEPVGGGRACATASLGVTATLEDGSSLVCSPVGQGAKWAPVPRS